MPEIKHDAPLSEIYIWENGKRSRVYRGDTREHIAWKMKEHEAQNPELVRADPPAPVTA
jgi:hypothetical protein